MRSKRRPIPKYTYAICEAAGWIWDFANSLAEAREIKSGFDVGVAGGAFEIKRYKLDPRFRG